MAFTRARTFDLREVGRSFDALYAATFHNDLLYVAKPIYQIEPFTAIGFGMYAFNVETGARVPESDFTYDWEDGFKFLKCLLTDENNDFLMEEKSGRNSTVYKFTPEDDGTLTRSVAWTYTTASNFCLMDRFGDRIYVATAVSDGTRTTLTIEVRNATPPYAIVDTYSGRTGLREILTANGLFARSDTIFDIFDIDGASGNITRFTRGDGLRIRTLSAGTAEAVGIDFPLERGQFRLQNVATHPTGFFAATRFEVTFLQETTPPTYTGDTTFTVPEGDTVITLEGIAGFPTPTLTVTSGMTLPNGVTLNGFDVRINLPDITRDIILTVPLTLTNSEASINISLTITVRNFQAPELTEVPMLSVVEGGDTRVDYTELVEGIPIPTLAFVGISPDWARVDGLSLIIENAPIVLSDTDFSIPMELENSIGTLPFTQFLTVQDRGRPQYKGLKKAEEFINIGYYTEDLGNQFSSSGSFNLLAYRVRGVINTSVFTSVIDGHPARITETTLIPKFPLRRADILQHFVFWVDDNSGSIPTAAPNNAYRSIVKQRLGDGVIEQYTLEEVTI